MGIEDVFNGSMDEEPVELPVEPTPAEEPQPEPQPVEPEQPQEPVVPAEPPQEEPRHVPLATFLDQRDEAKRWKREAEEAKAQLQQRQPVATPDPFDDPAGYAAHQKSVIEQSKIETRFEVSDMIARQMHGVETVDKAGEWASEKAKTDKSFALAYMQQPHPIDWIVQQHKRDQLMQQIGDDPDDFVRRRFAELNPDPAPNAAPVAAQQQQAPTPPTPPRSLATLPGNGGGAMDVPVGPMVGLESLFKG